MASYGVTFNSSKAKGMKQLKLHNIKEFLGQDPVRCKFVVDDRCLQQVQNFKYRGCETSYGKEKDIQQKLAKIVSNTGKSKQHFQTKIGPEIFKNKKVHNVLPLPILVYESEFWTLRQKRIKKVHINRHEIFQKTIFDHKLNEGISDRVESTTS